MQEVFDYKPKPWTMLIAVLFFGACGAGIGQMARTNDVGLVINHIIHLGPQGATIFYWALALASLAFVIAGFYGIWLALTSDNKLRVTAESVSIDKFGFRKRPVNLRFTDVNAMQHVKVSRQDFVRLQHTTGKLELARSMFANGEEFERCMDMIADRIRAS